jgi:hypothetical protein
VKINRKWWLWVIIAFACVMIVFGIAELTGASIINIFGWGILGILGFLAATLVSILALVFLVTPITWVIRALLNEFISNKEILYITLGSLGFCAILVGWILTTRQVWWSALVIMGGFAFGCLTGVEYQKHLLIDSNGYTKGIEQMHGEEKGEG